MAPGNTCDCLPGTTLTLVYRCSVEASACPEPFGSPGLVCHGPAEFEATIPLYYSTAAGERRWTSDLVCIGYWLRGVNCYDAFPDGLTVRSANYAEETVRFRLRCASPEAIQAQLYRGRSSTQEFYSSGSTFGSIKTTHCDGVDPLLVFDTMLDIHSCDPVDISGARATGPDCAGAPKVPWILHEEWAVTG